jgi:hypothetical protein
MLCIHTNLRNGLEARFGDIAADVRETCFWIASN